MKAIGKVSLLLLFNLTALFGQNQDNNWYFGGVFGSPNIPGAGLTFNTIVGGVPSALTDSGLGYVNNSSAAMSDENGQLLFYTNGIKVYNRLHQQMPTGLI